MHIQKTAYFAITIASILALLVYGQAVILPFVFALLCWFVIKKLRDQLDKIALMRRLIPGWLKSIFAALVLFAVLYSIFNVVLNGIERLSYAYPNYLHNVELISAQLSHYFNIDVDNELKKFISEFDFAGYLELAFNALSEILGNAVLIFFYVVFLLIEEHLFRQKIRHIFTSEKHYQEYAEITKQIDKSLSAYIGLKSLLSLLTAFLSYFVLVWSGIDAPVFWAFLIALLNFIPTVGPILGSLLPAFFSLLQFGEFFPFLLILIGTGIITTLNGSLLEPKVMGNNLNISPLVAIIALAFWGSIWGIPGMLLCVPITVAIIIILAQFPGTRNFAILLSERGQFLGKMDNRSND